MKYIAVKIGILADGKGSEAFQLFEEREPSVFVIAQGIQNDPVRLATAKQRLAEAQREFPATCDDCGGSGGGGEPVLRCPSCGGTGEKP